MHRNDSIMRAKNVQPYSDTVYAFMFDKGVFDLYHFPAWLDTLRKCPDRRQAPQRRMPTERIRPFGVTESDWWGGDSINANGYEYQAKRELGYFDYRFDMIVDDNPALAQQYNDFWTQNVGCVHHLWNPFYRTLSFSPALYNATMAATQSATKPILFLYGLDDTWTGAAVKDRYVNGTNVRKFVLPAQNHGVAFSSNTDPVQCNTICALLDDILAAPQAIDKVQSDDVQGTKVLSDGRLLIRHGEKTYTLTGQEIR